MPFARCCNNLQLQRAKRVARVSVAPSRGLLRLCTHSGAQGLLYAGLTLFLSGGCFALLPVLKLPCICSLLTRVSLSGVFVLGKGLERSWHTGAPETQVQPHCWHVHDKAASQPRMTTHKSTPNPGHSGAGGRKGKQWHSLLGFVSEKGADQRGVPGLERQTAG